MRWQAEEYGSRYQPSHNEIQKPSPYKNIRNNAEGIGIPVFPVPYSLFTVLRTGTYHPIAIHRDRKSVSLSKGSASEPVVNRADCVY